jgi:hypothetical protein
MGIIILLVILIIVLGVGLSFFGNSSSYMSDKNPRDRFSNDLTRDRHKSRVNKAMSRMEYIDESTITKKDNTRHDTSEPASPNKLKQSDKDGEDDFLKEYDDFFEQEDDPFNT